MRANDFLFIMTKPFANLTLAQQRVFEQIAINQDGGHDGRVLAALEKMGLIEQYTEHYGPWITYRWRVPPPVYIQWRQWCAEQPDDE